MFTRRAEAMPMPAHKLSDSDRTTVEREQIMRGERTFFPGGLVIYSTYLASGDATMDILVLCRFPVYTQRR